MLQIADKTRRWCPNLKRCGKKQVRYHKLGQRNRSGKYICDACNRVFTKEQMLTVNRIKKTNTERRIINSKIKHK